MLIYTTKTALGRSIDRSDQTINNMIKKGLVEEVFLVNSWGNQKKVGYILASDIVDNAVNIVQKEEPNISKKERTKTDTNTIKRTSIRTRFRILERDNFTCQYCGNKAPDVILHVDHKIPFSK